MKLDVEDLNKIIDSQTAEIGALKEQAEVMLDALNSLPNPKKNGNPYYVCAIGDDVLKKCQDATKPKPTPQDFKNLKHGVYEIFWKSGGTSLASVGSTHSGARWYSCCNWSSVGEEHPMVAKTDWSGIEKVELIKRHDYDVGVQ